MFIPHRSFTIIIIKQTNTFYPLAFLKLSSQILCVPCNEGHHHGRRQLVIMSIKQHIGVGVRIRPLLAEQTRMDQDCISVQGNRVTLTASRRLKHFDFPVLLDRHASQQQTFQTFVLPLLEDFLQGYSCAFLACGQSGSGKSYTICGGESQQSKGVIPRMLQYLETRLRQEERGRCMLRVSYVQICEEQVVDLLGIKRRNAPQLLERGRQVWLAGVDMKHVQTVQEVENYYILGNRKRQLAYSKKYRHPHKCTAIFTLHLQACQQREGREELIQGRMHIVDMAASRKVERFELNLPLSPRIKYDLSVSAIKNVANALVFGKNSTIPYGDSKVTMLLREYLGGYGKTKILFHLYPGGKGYSASVESLRTAKTISMVENQPHCHPDPAQITIAARIEELERARQDFGRVEQNLKKYQEQKQEGGEGEGDDNQFLTESLLNAQKQQQLKSRMEGLIVERMQIKKVIDNISSLFLKQPTTSAKRANQFRAKQERRKGSGSSVKKSLGQSWQNVETGGRALRQEVFELQQQFQQERELMLQRIRELEGEYKFFQRVSLQTVRQEEIDILRGSSKYDSTKRSYEVPTFAVRQKKLSLAERYYSPSPIHQSIDRRKFVLAKSISSKGLGMYKSGGLSASKLARVKQIVSPKKERPYEQQFQQNSGTVQRRNKGISKNVHIDEYELMPGKKNGNNKTVTASDHIQKRDKIIKKQQNQVNVKLFPGAKTK